MNDEEKEAIRELKHFISITPHWKLKEYTFSEVDNYIKITLNLIDKLQKENEEYHRIKKDLIRVNKKIYDVDTIDEFIETIEKLQKENTKLEKTIDLIIDDFQAENYFVGMTNKEVREYYKKRKELKE